MNLVIKSVSVFYNLCINVNSIPHQQGVSLKTALDINRVFHLKQHRTSIGSFT